MGFAWFFYFTMVFISFVFFCEYLACFAMPSHKKMANLTLIKLNFYKVVFITCTFHVHIAITYTGCLTLTRPLEESGELS